MAEQEDDLDVSDITDDDNLEEMEQEIHRPVARTAPRPVARTAPRPAARPAARPAPAPQEKESPDRYQYVYQQELSGVLDKTTGQVTTDILAILADIKNTIERIEQSL
jgi:uncharacterized membrane protein